MRVVVDAIVEGFVDKSQYALDPDTYGAFDVDWNPHKAWVSIEPQLVFTFDVAPDESDDGGRFSPRLLSIELDA